ncbi:MAG: hypothetical protein IJC52_03720 [Clostridia bacterium]|nr:hypothetical protein [Clostridia bacterium]
MEEQWSVPVTETAEPSPSGNDTEALAATDPVADNAVTTPVSAAEETTSPAQTESAAQQTPDENTYLPVYNGKVCPVRADDRQEITTLLQLGMKQRDFLPSYERLTRMARDLGMPSVKALIDGLCDARENTLLQEALETYGEEHGRRFYELEKAQREQRYNELTAEKQAQTRAEAEDDAARLAEQFSELAKVYPQCRDIRELPPSVVQTAIAKNIPLLDAYNRFVIAEQQRQQQQAAQSAKAAAQSTGSLADAVADAPSSAMDAFLSGLHRRA